MLLIVGGVLFAGGLWLAFGWKIAVGVTVAFFGLAIFATDRHRRAHHTSGPDLGV
jgi:hypothetical protein